MTAEAGARRSAVATREPAPAPGTALVCAGCGHRVADALRFVVRCPAAVPGDDVDHVIRREPDTASLVFPSEGEPETFVRYRTHLRAWHVARAAGWTDARFVELARQLDQAIEAVDGHGFRETPFEPAPGLASAVGLAPGALWVKDETRNVAGSHKARHLAGLMLELLVADAVAPDSSRGPLAIASCGNAALAAAVVARAAGRPLDVFVPTWADAAVLERLQTLGARVVACPRVAGLPGDPTVHALLTAVAVGAIPFTCQGSENGLAIEGGQTLGAEMVARLARTPAEGSRVALDAVVVQVGGGALASAVAAGFAEARAAGAIEREPRLYAVQTAGCAPLERAWRAVCARADADGMPAGLEHARRHRSAYMRPWDEEPASAAHGILDDETYDWFAIVEAMARTGGEAVVVDEATVLEANDLARVTTRIDVDHTGTAGLAGLLALRRSGRVRPDETVAVLFTGARRHDRRPTPTVPAIGATLRPAKRSAP